MWWRGITLRWRLTLLYAVLGEVLVLVLGIFVYSQLERFMNETLTAQVQTQGRIFQTRRPQSSDKGASLSIQQLSDQANQIATAALYITILDRNGVVVTSRDSTLPPPPVAVALPDITSLRRIGTSGQSDSVTLVSGDRGVRFVLPLRSTGGSSGNDGYVVVAASLHDVDAVLGQLRVIFLLGLVGVLVLAVLLGLPVAGLSLRPLARVTATARHIARSLEQGDIAMTRRVTLPARTAQDDIARLVSAFNTMLDQIAGAFAVQEASENRMRRFMADASHELRSPLTALGGMLDVLLRGAGRDDPATLDRALAMMRREVDRMSRLVVDLLTLTRFDAADPAAIPMRVELRLANLVAETVAERQQLRPTPQRLTVTCTDGCAPIVVGDTDQLRAVLTNLLDNAVRHTPPTGEIHITVGLDGSNAILRVADTGEGIAADHLPRLFDRFYRVDPARARATGSVGLGLAIVKTIVEAHGGTIRVASTPHIGTTFTISLPRVAKDVENIAEIGHMLSAKI